MEGFHQDLICINLLAAPRRGHAGAAALRLRALGPDRGVCSILG
jgi:hypothetical protein